MFLLSRIRRTYTGDTVASVAAGLERTSRIVYPRDTCHWRSYSSPSRHLRGQLPQAVRDLPPRPSGRRHPDDPGPAVIWRFATSQSCSTEHRRPCRHHRQVGLRERAGERSGAAHGPPRPPPHRARPGGENATMRESWPPPPDCPSRPATRRRSPSTPWPRPSASRHLIHYCTSPTRPSFSLRRLRGQFRQLDDEMTAAEMASPTHWRRRHRSQAMSAHFDANAEDYTRCSCTRTTSPTTSTRRVPVPLRDLQTSPGQLSRVPRCPRRRRHYPARRPPPDLDRRPLGPGPRHHLAAARRCPPSPGPASPTSSSGRLITRPPPRASQPFDPPRP